MDFYLFYRAFLSFRQAFGEETRFLTMFQELEKIHQTFILRIYMVRVALKGQLRCAGHVNRPSDERLSGQVTNDEAANDYSTDDYRTK